MPAYKYVAQNAEGKKVRGTAAAADRSSLHRQLKEEGLFLLSADESRTMRRVTMLKPREISEFCRQIGTLVGNSVSLARALAIICEQEGIPTSQRRIYQEVTRSVRSGLPLSEALEAQNGVFPDLVIYMFRSAEAGGNLDHIAMQMANHYDKQWRLNAKVRNAMLYPKILGVLIVAVVFLIMTFILPQFSELFEQMESLPIFTVVLMAISDFVAAYWYAVLISAIALVLLYRWIRTVPDIRIKMDQALVHLPKIGFLEKTIFTSRFARTMASLYCSGLPIVSSLTIARHAVGNLYIDQQFDEVIPFVRSGGNLSDGLSRVDGFVNKLEFTIRVGEETGSLDSMLETTADAMEYESEMALQRLVSILEPAMIILMALIVGFVMLAVIVPIYSSYETIGAM